MELNQHIQVTTAVRYSITLSARTNSAGGTVTPIAPQSRRCTGRHRKERFPVCSLNLQQKPKVLPKTFMLHRALVISPVAVLSLPHN